ncbi:uncharacterized protein IUM83_05585 [Phytophthora cinnamomi]|uniref:uncharacterized protein n=1 Tax=Phytophthora cinnamomi TaxID=4785 RepID=UPI00355964DC|nr:hypothetical protein IUM83_05585 [Phytophthora cinnamomi]
MARGRDGGHGGAGRHAPRAPIDTQASKHKLRVLGEFFPTVAVDVRRDVLVAANYREDVAAAMLGDLAQEPSPAAASAHAQDRTELLFVDLHAVDDGASELADEEGLERGRGRQQRHRRVGRDPGRLGGRGQARREGPHFRRRAACGARSGSGDVDGGDQSEAAGAAVAALHPGARPVPSRTLKMAESDRALPTYELERGVKSFGARKRHLLKHRR